MNMAPIDIINGGGAQNLPWIASSVSEEGIYPITSNIALISLNKIFINVYKCKLLLMLFYYYSIFK